MSCGACAKNTSQGAASAIGAPQATGEIGITDAELAALRAKTARMSALLRRALHGPIYHDDALAEDIETELDGAR